MLWIELITNTSGVVQALGNDTDLIAVEGVL